MHSPAPRFGDFAGELFSKGKLALMLLAASVCLLLSGFTFQSRQAPAAVTKTVTATEEIPFSTTYINLPDKLVGYTQEVKNGVPGQRQVEAQVITVNDKITQVLSVKSTQTVQPVNAVVKRGTKIIPTETVSGTWRATFTRPIRGGWLSADFYDYPGHNGVDFAAPKGTAVLASAGGTVTMSSWWGPYGYCVIIDHGSGVQTLYAHNSSLLVKKGQSVKQGQQIARVGTTGNSTGNHLHFEIRTSTGFLDPLVYIGQYLSS